MASQQLKIQTVVWYAEHKCAAIVYEMFRIVYKRNPPDSETLKSLKSSINCSRN